MWIRDVDVPGELVEAARAGRLVLFVGAGASVDPPANLPNFRDLVKDVGSRVRTPPTEADLQRPDKFLGTLEDRKIKVHDLVAKAIDVPESRPNRLHMAIVDLARAHPPVRIVTTNYDRHLTSVVQTAGLDVEVFRGPALPTGDDFVGIVHLHGSLDQETRRLVVTDADFGHAYIREAWAARFLDRMFSAFTVLFIGYSYGDLVMQYLGRSLGRGGPRFVLTHREDLPEWKSYGLTPVVYKAPEGSHIALTETLERWADLANRGRTEHRRLIADLVSAGPPAALENEPPNDDEGMLPPERVLTPEESSYLEEALGDPERVQYFVENARGSEWLSWVATRPEFTRLFMPTEPTDERATSVAHALTTWVADHYVTVEGESPTALRVMRERKWTQSTLSVITHRLFAQEGVVPIWQTPWLLLCLQQEPLGRNDVLDMLLTKESWAVRPDLALLLFQYRTRPVLAPAVDWGGPKTPPTFDIVLLGKEHWLTSAWTKVFVPILDDYAQELLDLVTGHLRAAQQLLRSTRPEAHIDVLSFGRSAIEPHEQDDTRSSMDVLIDAARDCIERLLIIDSTTAGAYLNAWIKAEEGLFRRLAVHGWRVREDQDFSHKLRWIFDQNLLWDLDAQHEVFLLLEQVVPEAAPEEVQCLLDRVSAGPPNVADEVQSPYRPYNLLAWLARVAPEVAAITEAFKSCAEEHPDYGPREHPDLNMVVTGGIAEDTEPFTAEELHAKFAYDPQMTLAELGTFRSINEFQLTGPTWRGAVKSVRGCATKYPADGLLLAGLLSDSDRDLRWALIDAWAEADLDQDQIVAAVAAISTWEVDEIRGHAAQMLGNGGRDGRPTEWHKVSSARELATRLWPVNEVTGNVIASDDRIFEAINHPAGDLAQFWTKVVQFEWRSDQVSWTGLPANLADHLDPILRAEGRNGVLARTILGANLHFYFAADPEWARMNILPRFNWNTHPIEASAMWQGFLAQGRPDDGLLEAGLLDLYLQCCEHTDELGRRRSRAQLADHLAVIAMFTSSEPEDWLPTFVTTAPTELRGAWCERVASRLSDLTDEESTEQWTRWMRAYWTDRVESVPLPLEGQEASNMAQWVLSLPNERIAAVELVKRSDAKFVDHDPLLHRLAEMDLSTDALIWTEFVTYLLRGTLEPNWEIHHYLPQIVATLRNADLTLDLSALIEEAMRLGCIDAPEW